VPDEYRNPLGQQLLSDKRNGEGARGLDGDDTSVVNVACQIQDGKQAIPVSILGVHPLNRSGVYPMEETVTNLGMTILDIGFSVDEANHEGVCVQEAPTGEAKNVKLGAEGPYETYLAYNKRKRPQLRLSVRRSVRPIPLLMGHCLTATCY